MVLRRLSAGFGRLRPADRVEKAVACQERDQGVALGPGATPLFHEILRAEGPYPTDHPKQWSCLVLRAESQMRQSLRLRVDSGPTHPRPGDQSAGLRIGIIGSTPPPSQLHVEAL